MGRLTFKNDNGTWGLKNYDIKKVPSELYGAICKLKDYEDLGTVEELQQAMERQTAISRVVIEGQYFCPKCKNLMKYPGYCGCGQKLY